jgi:hypothetical protein
MRMNTDSNIEYLSSLLDLNSMLAILRSHRINQLHTLFTAGTILSVKYLPN